MTTENDLFTLKKTSQSAESAYDAYMSTKQGLFMLASLATAGLAVVGSAPLIAGVALGSLWLMGVGVGFIVVGVGAFLPAWFSYTSKTNKKLVRLLNAKDEASTAYLSALMTEARSFGLETATLSKRTMPLDDSYEFTALRNGSPIDVAVREFDSELVFMLNGERMQKPVSV